MSKHRQAEALALQAAKEAYGKTFSICRGRTESVNGFPDRWRVVVRDGQGSTHVVDVELSELAPKS